MKINIRTWNKFFQVLLPKGGRNLFVSVFIFSGLNVLGQTTVNSQTKLPDVFPVNPKAAEFFKYSEIPVGKYTGVPSINIPIFTIKGPNTEIPISLMYHSNGVKVAEEAGWTGLGWSLDAGGSITQVVNGFDDFGYYKNRDNELDALMTACGVPQTALDNNNQIDFALYDYGSGQVALGYGSSSNPSTFYSYSFDHAKTEGFKDVRPDVFKFSMMGQSGEFLLDWKTETFKCISDQNIKIEAPNYSVNSSQPATFRITTPDGNQYLFELKEESVVSGMAYYTATTPSQLDHMIGSKSSRTYQLTTIITIGGEVISFNYVQTGILENLPSISLSHEFEEGSNGVPVSEIHNNPTSTTVNYSRQSLSYLSSIEFPEGKLIFNSTADRIDFIGMRKLNSIVLTDRNNIPIKSFSLNYDYFVGHTNGNNTDSYLDAASPVYHTGKISTELTHRLRLLSITESGKPPYLFEYDPEVLPKKTSLATDNWGLYNKKFNNVDFMPNIYMTGLKDIIGLNGITNNRNSNIEGSRAAILNKITYPTGGTTSFDYELNSFENFRVPDDAHATVTSIFLNDRNNTGDNSAQIFSSDVASVLYAGTLNISTYGPMSNQTNGLSAYIRLTVLQKTPANVSLTNNTASFWSLYNSTPLGQLGNQVSGVINDSRILQFDLINGQYYETFKLAENQAIAIDPDKIYILQAYLDNSFGPQTNSSQGAGASVYFTYLQNTSHTVSYGAGLRVKTIITKDPSSPALVKSYQYSGGKLMSPLLYLTNLEYNYAPIGLSTLPIWKTQIGSSSFLPISTNASGKFVGYDEVTEYNSTLNPIDNSLTNNNGKVVELYTNQPDKGSFNTLVFFDPSQLDGTEMSLPFVAARTYLNFLAPLQRARIQNGLVLRKQVYNQNQSLSEETENNWNYVIPPVKLYNRISLMSQNSAPEPISGYVFHLWEVGFYPFVSTKTLLSSTIKKTYSGLNPIISTINNIYDSHDQLTRTETTDSKNNTVIQTFSHPYDFGAYYLTMAYGSNVITPVIETQTLINASPSPKLISTVHEDYNQVGGGAIGPVSYLKSRTAVAVGSANLEDKITYDLYEVANTPNRYKLLQYHDNSGVITSLFWGYGGQYLVAKVVGIDYNTAKQTINQTTLDNAGSISDASLRSELNNLRAIPGAFVTTYTYRPLIGLTSETDPNSRTSYYEYDSYNRLNIVKDLNNNIIRKFCYSAYSDVPGICGAQTYYNLEVSNTFTKNDCGPNYFGNSVLYVVPANTYSSAISQADAQLQAQANINANGQAYANSHGTCTPITSTATISGNTNFSISQNSGSGQIVKAPGSLVTLNITATGMPGSTQSLAITITGATTFGGPLTVTNGSAYVYFVMPATGNVTWSGTFTSTTSASSGSIVAY